MEHNKGKKQSLIADQFDLLMENVKGYIETRVEIAKLDAKSESASMISFMITSFGVALLGGMAIMFLLISLALALGEWLGHNSLGFLIIFIFFGAVFVIYALFFMKIQKYVNVFVDNRISERENIAEEDIEMPKEQEKPIKKQTNKISETELNQLELADNEELTSIHQASINNERDKTIFAPKKEE
ncbi:MAG: putative membrane protein YqjE [Arenicella sp.]|jgi:uncharacterized membrane protein YqjE